MVLFFAWYAAILGLAYCCIYVALSRMLTDGGLTVAFFGATFAALALGGVSHTAWLVKPLARKCDRRYPIGTPLRTHMESPALKPDLERARPNKLEWSG